MKKIKEYWLIILVAWLLFGTWGLVTLSVKPTPLTFTRHQAEQFDMAYNHYVNPALIDKYLYGFYRLDDDQRQLTARQIVDGMKASYEHSGLDMEASFQWLADQVRQDPDALQKLTENEAVSSAVISELLAISYLDEIIGDSWLAVKSQLTRREINAVHFLSPKIDVLFEDITDQLLNKS